MADMYFSICKKLKHFASTCPIWKAHLVLLYLLFHGHKTFCHIFVVNFGDVTIDVNLKNKLKI